MTDERTTPDTQQRRTVELIDQWFDLCERILTVQRQSARAMFGMLAPLVSPLEDASQLTRIVMPSTDQRAQRDDRTPART
jgi:hypothetical protein